ncbi:MAG: 3-oxoacyl-ACP reductase [Rhizobiales bacterium 24-66-13]|jgi:3-oxoacyl-[acyl-carrier protein] reductase|nr:MAG: 3-oxoacyl-ACP reductase [Rhizobiales bacterium 35-66-30]OYZ82210.1 MAG: 3-oxoacyl-ACP reductase [Rhizobiales bacterium 24-66-13]OZA98558.1 MAG: 3-oxoacyl-ACP reductase [Rhizobiales bacterium 39-66-18]HQS08203.1 SDR family NAD(P)-dependent oxidoreductase [Xanthobacteraceae bacterium]HQS48531.1 SDR family NAD(P)-dependent oxidoreductase [Xanthobacteraceae bacterium]
MFDFTGKTLFLTGANGGISRAVAQTFFECGANCVLTDLDAEGMEAFARTLDPSGARVVATRQDAADPDDADRALALAKERFGALDFLVTSAGLYRARQVAEMDDAYWRQGIAVNLDGVFYTCRRAIPLLADGAAIVNLASMAGHRGSFAHADYSAAKGAVLAFSRSLAIELAPRVRVNAVSPGLIDTPMVRGLMDAKGAALLDQTPMKRLGTVEEVARVVAFLCSDWASFVTGETVHVNGGLYIAS